MGGFKGPPLKLSLRSGGVFNPLDFASNEASKIGANYIAVVAYYNHYLGGDHIEVNAYKCSEIKSEIVDDKKLI